MRMNSTFALLCALSCGLVLLLACGVPDPQQTHLSHEAEALAEQECAVCGMLVRDRSAPRGQVVHRDGSRFFLCSVGDLMVHLSSPSPHGRAAGIFVEVMEPEEDPALSLTDRHPWVAAADGFHVVGVERSRIMGRPVLVYSDRRSANAVASRYPGARVVDFAELETWWRDGLH